jgi:hypothetical protein
MLNLKKPELPQCTLASRNKTIPVDFAKREVANIVDPFLTEVTPKETCVGIMSLESASPKKRRACSVEWPQHMEAIRPPIDVFAIVAMIRMNAGIVTDAPAKVL